MNIDKIKIKYKVPCPRSKVKSAEESYQGNLKIGQQALITKSGRAFLTTVSYSELSAKWRVWVSG